MTRNEFVEHYAAVCNVSLERADTLVELFTGLIVASLKSGHSVVLDNFGTFLPVAHSAHRAGAPPNAGLTAGAMTVRKARYHLKFQTSKKLCRSMAQWPVAPKLHEKDSL